MSFLDGHQEVVHAAFGDPVIDGCFEARDRNKRAGRVHFLGYHN